MIYRQEMCCFIHKDEDLAEDTLMNRKPMELFKDGDAMVIFTRPTDKFLQKHSGWTAVR